MANTTFSPPSYQQLLQQMANDMQQGSAQLGYNNGLGLPTNPGSELYLRFSTLAGQSAIQDQMVFTLVQSKLIATATGADLDTVAGNFGLQRRGATNAIGFVQLN